MTSIDEARHADRIARDEIARMRTRRGANIDGAYYPRVDPERWRNAMDSHERMMNRLALARVFWNAGRTIVLDILNPEQEHLS